MKNPKYFIKRLITEVFYFFHQDRKKIPRALKSEYKKIFFRTLHDIRELPSIFTGSDLNNKIKWLMIYERNELKIECADKVSVRDYVARTVGNQYLNRLYGVWPEADSIDFDLLPGDFVLKANHDAGSVWLVKNKNNLDQKKISATINKKLSRVFGRNNGQWPNVRINPKVLAEEFLGEDLPDWKFHCCNGSVRFLQYIYDRHGKTAKEEIILPSGKKSDLTLDHDFTPGASFSKPANWTELLEVARSLSKPFKYCRVDLYLANGEVRFGELTFYPKNGNYKGSGQRRLGELIDFERGYEVSG